MPLRDKLNTSLKDALKSKEKVSVATIRLILAALKDKDIAARSKGNVDGISNDEILAMLQTMIKQRNESTKMYREGGREELAAQEQEEIVVIKCFMPEQIEGKELESVVVQLIEEHDAQSIRDMGKLMGALKSDYAGRVDMGKAGGLIKQKLA